MKIFFYLCRLKIRGTIAQLVEQRTENPCVPGSIPGGTTSIRVTYEESSLKYCIINKLPISWFNIYKRYFHCFWQFV